MTKLEELESELYREEGKEDIESRQKKRFFLSPSQTNPPHSWKEPEETGGVRRSPLFERRATKIAIGVVLTLIASAGALFLFLYFGSRPQEVAMRVEAREEIESGETLTLSIPYENISRSPLRDVELTIILPRGTRVREGGNEYEAPARITKSLSDVVSGEERVEEITVRMFGKESESIKVDTILSYRPENVSARFTAEASKVFKVVRVPLGITWDVPETLAEGQEVDLLVRYSSNSRDTFSNLSLRLDFPPGFTFKDSNPKPSAENTVWNIGELKAGGSGVVTIRGSVTGEEGEIKTFRGGVGVYSFETREWTPYFDSFREAKIAVTPLWVEGRLGGAREATIDPGQQLRFSVRYQNNTPYPLKDVTVRTVIDGSILDLPTMTIGQGGVFDFESRSIVWGPANVEDLAEIPPGAGGSLSFSVNTKDTPSVKTSDDQKLVVRLSSHIEASGIPQELIGTDLKHDDVTEFKVNSKVIFAGKALYTYPPLPNTGPIPPKVGQKTTYAIVWEIRNFTNDLKNAEVKALLPPNVKWERVFIPANTSLTYTESSGEIKWKIGTVEAGRGVTSPALTTSFRISVIPSEVDIGKDITLLPGAILTAEDSFTGTKVEKSLPAFSTLIPADPVIKEGGIVVP